MYGYLAIEAEYPVEKVDIESDLARVGVKLHLLRTQDSMLSAMAIRCGNFHIRVDSAISRLSAMRFG